MEAVHQSCLFCLLLAVGSWFMIYFIATVILVPAFVLLFLSGNCNATNCCLIWRKDENFPSTQFLINILLRELVGWKIMFVSKLLFCIFSAVFKIHVKIHVYWCALNVTRVYSKNQRIIQMPPSIKNILIIWLVFSNK